MRGRKFKLELSRSHVETLGRAMGRELLRIGSEMEAARKANDFGVMAPLAMEGADIQEVYLILKEKLQKGEK